MKSLDKYILEKFQITKDSKVLYTCQPKDKVELRKILEERLAVDKNADLNDIDVSAVKDMTYLFDCADPHNIKIDKWDVSNVKDMERMFNNCENFNCNLGNWDVYNVESMHYMFYGCQNFLGDGLENWKPIKCRYMSNMFEKCYHLNCNLGDWDVRNVVDMQCMFSNCGKFEGKGLEKWNPIKCEDMIDMFEYCNSLKNIPTWYEE